MPFTISSTIPEIAARLGRGIPPQLLAAGVDAIAEALADPMTAATVAEEPEDTGELKRRTASHVYAAGDSAILETSSEAENTSGQYYAYFVYTQHRIVAWGHDTGRLSTPNLFPERALARMTPQIEAESRAAAEETGLRVLRILQ